jgi:GT2 family glycosyltransferase
MRPAINMGMSIARGNYVMKADDHCMFGPGYDEILSADCDDNWLAVPSRYSLDGENWRRKYGPIDYDFLTYPYNLDDQFGFGFHGKKWHGAHGFTGGYFDREKERKHILIDDMLTFQGSCWFMTKQQFMNIGGMQFFGYMDHQEAQEMGFKVWLSGGRCVVNKKTWYAHLHKGNLHGRGYRLFKHRMINSQIYSAELWLNNGWEGQTRKLKWLIEHPSWWPLESWPEDWDDPKYWFKYDYKTWHHSFMLQKEREKNEPKVPEVQP